MVARTLAASSSEMQSLAVGWQLYELTHRALDLGLVGLAQFLPGICLFLLAGHVADRVPRLRIVQTCYIGFATCSVLFFLLTEHGLHTPWPLYAILLINGTVRAFNAPASQAILPSLVPESVFPNAVTWSASIFQTAMVAGPMIGGVLYGATGSPVIVYLWAATAYCVSLILLRTIKLQSKPRERVAASVGIVLEGVRYIFRNKLLLGAMSLDLFAVLLGGAMALLPVYAKEILNIGAFGLGLLRGAPAAGAVIVALILAHRPLHKRAGATMLACVFGFGIFTVFFGISHNLWLSLVMLIVLGASDMVSVIVRHTLVQLATPDDMRGRVSAVNTVFIGASNEVGQFESGLTAHWFGAVPAVVMGGIGTMLIVAAWTGLFPALRKVDALTTESIHKAQ